MTDPAAIIAALRAQRYTADPATRYNAFTALADLAESLTNICKAPNATLPRAGAEGFFDVVSVTRVQAAVVAALDSLGLATEVPTKEVNE